MSENQTNTWTSFKKPFITVETVTFVDKSEVSKAQKLDAIFPEFFNFQNDVRDNF